MELQQLPTTHCNDADTAEESSTFDNVDTLRTETPHQTLHLPSHDHHNQTTFSTWWTTHISLTIPDHPPHDSRDYLALERTFLGWFRTSTTLVSLGVIVTQLFVLHDVDPTKGKVLGCVLAGAAIAILVGAAGRYFRAQRLLLRGKALTGGWEAVGVWAVIGVVLGVLFLVVVIED